MLSIATGSANPAAVSASRSKAYCQMPNHVHLILTPQDGEGLGLALSRRRRLTAGFVNARARQTGHLF
jgi:putative transposase